MWWIIASYVLVFALGGYICVKITDRTRRKDRMKYIEHMRAQRSQVIKEVRKAKEEINALTEELAHQDAVIMQMSKKWALTPEDQKEIVETMKTSPRRSSGVSSFWWIVDD